MTTYRLLLRILQNRLISSTFIFLCIGGVCHPNGVLAAESYAIVGKNDWLFVKHETVLEALDKDVPKALSLIARFNRMLARNQIALAFVVVPSKMETYVEQLPDDFKVSAYMKGFNDAVLAALRADGVNVIDLKAPLRAAALENGASPLFFRLDTHWTPSGAMAAAQAIRAGVTANPSLNKALDAVPTQKYRLAWASKAQRQVKPRDITFLLPAGTPMYPAEEILRFKLSRDSEAPASLFGGSTSGTDLGLVGSSFSGPGSGFADALRYTLQRDVMNFYVEGDAGPWAVMRAYLRDDAFQVRRPKLLIWEVPERVVGLRPSYAFRAERYKIDDNEWLLQVAALVQGECLPTNISAKMEVGSLYQGQGVIAGKVTKESDFVDISLDVPADNRSYLSARLTTNGSKQVAIEAMEAGGSVRKFSVDVAGDDLSHIFKIPLGLSSRGVNRIRLYPGNTNSFSLSEVKVCRYPED